MAQQNQERWNEYCRLMTSENYGWDPGNFSEFEREMNEFKSLKDEEQLAKLNTLSYETRMELKGEVKQQVDAWAQKYFNLY